MRKEGEASSGIRDRSTRRKRCGRCPVPRSRTRNTSSSISTSRHDFTDPLAWSHNKVEGKREYTSLLYIPGRAPFDLWQRDAARGLKLYVRRVFIMDDAEQFLPQYLRFVKGIVDSSDLPLNVSRELLQQDPEVDAIRNGLTKRVLDMLAKHGEGRAGEVRNVLEGVRRRPQGRHWSRIMPTRTSILPLLRFASTHEPDNEPTASLRAVRGAHEARSRNASTIIIAESLDAARSSPYIEELKERGLEVLLLAERIDEWVMGQLDEFEGKKFKDASRGDLELGGLENEEDKKKQRRGDEGERRPH